MKNKPKTARPSLNVHEQLSDKLKLPYVITIDKKRNYIVNVFRWFTAPKIDFRNNELNMATMTNYESETIQTNLL